MKRLVQWERLRLCNVQQSRVQDLLYNVIKMQQESVSNYNRFENNLDFETLIDIQRGLTVRFPTLTNINITTFNEAVNEVLQSTPRNRKGVVLFLQKTNDVFSQSFLRSLEQSNICDIINRFFHFTGWNIDDTSLHFALRNVLEIYNLHDVIGFDVASVYIIVPFNNFIQILTIINQPENILEIFQYAEKYFQDSLKDEETPNNDVDDDKNCFGPIEYQQLRAKMLSDRDYDRFENNLDFKTPIDIQRGLTVRFPTLTNINITTFNEAVNEVLQSTPRNRKGVVLFLQKTNDVFSQSFLRSLEQSNICDIINRFFHFTGWNIDDTSLHFALRNVLELYNLHDVIGFDVASVYIIVPFNNFIRILTIINQPENILEIFQYAEKYFQDSLKDEVTPNNDVDDDKNCFGPIEYQQLMAEMLSDRDYDRFDHNQDTLLKKKIGFALFGQPDNENGNYEEKENEKIKQLFEIILECSNPISKEKDMVEISFIYNCTEPLEEEKLKRAKNMLDYNPKADFSAIPLFVLRKCFDSTNPCRIFIDNIGRVYDSWENYKENNKLPQCVMLLPENGRYQFDSNGTVLLERSFSPACGIGQKVLAGADVASVTGGLASVGVFGIAAIPAVTLAPAVIAVAAGTGVCVGVYGLGRSVFNLVDRVKHKESLSFANSEARAAYLNIIAGSLGFVGVGANALLSQMAIRGMQIGKNVNVTVNIVNVLNIGASGASLVNSGYDVLDQMYNEKKNPSLLTIVQLSSSALFFGNAVFNFKTAGTIIEETQAKVITDYSDSLRSNRHRKTFKNVIKATVKNHDGNVAKGHAEVISTIRNIPNKNDVFASLTRNTKQFTKNGLRYAAANGEITLNGHSINMNDLIKLNSVGELNLPSYISSQVNSFVPTQPESENSILRSTIRDFCGLKGGNNLVQICQAVHKLIANFNGDVRTLILNGLKLLLKKIMPEFRIALQTMFPKMDVYIELIQMMLNYFQQTYVNDLEKDYQQWSQSNDPKYYHPLFDIVPIDKVQRSLQFFQFFIKIYFNDKVATDKTVNNLFEYFRTWITIIELKRQTEEEQQFQRRKHSAGRNITSVFCEQCNGKHWKLQSESLKKVNKRYITFF